MEIVSCKECGKLFNFIRGQRVCPACSRKLEDNQTENTNVTTENKPQSEPLHKSFCRECGTMISEKADICPNCGATQHRAKVIDDTPSAGLKVLSFFIPLVGLILFVVQSKDTPISAKEYGKWALIGFCTGIALSIVWYFVVLASVSSMFKAFSF